MDRFQKLNEYEKNNFEKPEKYSDDVIIIEIILFKGRLFEAKKKLNKTMVANLVDNLGIDKNDVLIVLNDVDKENWGIHGGYPASEVDIGFDTNV